jgi:hypothetical protein
VTVGEWGVVMEDKTRFITPLLTLLAGAIAAVIMFARGFEFTRMLWTLLIVLIIFYFLGDTARYIYSKIRPRIIPDVDYDEMERQVRESLDLTGNVVEFADDERNGEDSENEETDKDEEAGIDTNSDEEYMDEGE